MELFPRADQMAGKLAMLNVKKKNMSIGKRVIQVRKRGERLDQRLGGGGGGSTGKGGW